MDRHLNFLGGRRGEKGRAGDKPTLGFVVSGREGGLGSSSQQSRKPQYLVPVD